jgi:hypothetical protein
MTPRKGTNRSGTHAISSEDRLDDDQGRLGRMAHPQVGLQQPGADQALGGRGLEVGQLPAQPGALLLGYALDLDPSGPGDQAILDGRVLDLPDSRPAPWTAMMVASIRDPPEMEAGNDGIGHPARSRMDATGMPFQEVRTRWRIRLPCCMPDRAVIV